MQAAHSMAQGMRHLLEDVAQVVARPDEEFGQADSAGDRVHTQDGTVPPLR